MDTLEHLFEQNVQWAEEIKQQDPQFFTRLAKLQKPEYLWIGCSDSRIPANQIVKMLPGEMFVHRNIANLVVHTDLNCLSVIQYAVEVLKVKHIIVCGHFGCGGVLASMEAQQHGLIDNWLGHIRDVGRYHAEKLDKLEGREKSDLLCELNVIEQVKNVCNTATVQKAWSEGSNLSVHGWIYSLEEGLLKDLNSSYSSAESFLERQ